MTSEASLDKTSKLITVAICVLFGILSIRQVSMILNNDATLQSIGVLAVLLSIVFFSFLFRTTAYSLSSEELVIHRPVKNVSVAISNIKFVQPVAPENLKGTIRTFGVGGLFGYYGTFSNSKLGKMTWYLTQKRNMVLIHTHLDQTILISPDEQQFVDRLLLLHRVT